MLLMPPGRHGRCQEPRGGPATALTCAPIACAWLGPSSHLPVWRRPLHAQRGTPPSLAGPDRPSDCPGATGPGPRRRLEEAVSTRACATGTRLPRRAAGPSNLQEGGRAGTGREGEARMSTEPRPTILYVDDDESHRRAFSWIFRNAGFEVKEAGTGNEALRMMEDRPDLVILDVSLPDINGFEVCRRIKAHPGTRSTPVLHLSGMFVKSEDKAHALDEGADGYLTKPVEPEEVLATVKALLRVRQAEEAARAAARQWQATFDAISYPLCLLDADGHVVRCNRAMCDLLRRPLPALVGRAFDELVAEALGPVEEGFFGRARQTRRREVAEVPLAGRWFLAAADPVVGERGQVTGSVHHLSDITELRRSEEERTRLLAERARLAESLRLLLESTGEGIFGLDLEGRCTFVNRAAAEMFGRRPEELVGQNLHALTHHSHADGSPFAEEFCAVAHT